MSENMDYQKVYKYFDKGIDDMLNDSSVKGTFKFNPYRLTNIRFLNDHDEGSILNFSDLATFTDSFYRQFSPILKRKYGEVIKIDNIYFAFDKYFNEMKESFLLELKKPFEHRIWNRPTYILCLSKHNPRCFNNIMWKRYAKINYPEKNLLNDLKWFEYEYRISNSLQFMNSVNPNNTSQKFLTGWGEVKYGLDYGFPITNQVIDEKNDKISIINSLYIESLLRKSSFWASEDEFRFILIDNTDDSNTMGDKYFYLDENALNENIIKCENLELKFEKLLNFHTERNKYYNAQT